MLKNIIIEGCDRLGKGTLIKGLLNHLGYFQVVHYQKPMVLNAYCKPPLVSMEDVKREALKTYQVESFKQMFQMLTGPGMYIMDRAHLGEVVYAPRYRGYSGDYVFDLEQNFIDVGSDFHETSLLVLLTTTSWGFVQDDGESFDFSQKDHEQTDFKFAFERSRIKRKLMIDVNDFGGHFRSPSDIQVQVIREFQKQ